MRAVTPSTRFAILRCLLLEWKLVEWGEDVHTRHSGDFFSLLCNFYLLGSLLLSSHNPHVVLQTPLSLCIASVSRNRAARALCGNSAAYRREDFV
jgi:hypothetical protein